MPLKTVAVSDVGPNPFRHLDRYPINREKVEALKLSFKDTGVWPNLLGRKARGDAAKKYAYELAYGHHRLQAMKECGVKEFPMFIV